VFLPDGRRFFYLRAFRTAPERSGIFVGSLDVAPDQQDRRRVLPTTTSVSYVAHDAGGTLLFLRDGNLMAQAFDDRRTALSGDATLVAERVEAYRDGATMSASTNGVLVYRDAPSYQLTWLDRHGRVIGRLGETGLYQTVSMSADGSRALVSRASSQVASAGQLWLWDFVRQTSSRVSSVDADVAIWSPDASRFIADARTGLLLVPTDGLQPPETVLSAEPGVRRTPTSWSPDGTHLLFTVSNPKTSADLFVLPLVGEKKEIPFLQSEWAESQGQFSPDPRQPLWVAYTSNETGRDEVSVRQFPGGAGKEMVSRGGGHSPLWRADGRELFYIAADGSVMSAEFVNSRLSPPVALLKAPPGFASRDATGLRLAAPWGITPDGQRFLFAASSAPTGVTPFTVVLNWR
jgi:hypothetical protein